MESTTQKLSSQKFEEPVLVTHPEPWQWELLAKAFLNDPTLNYWFGGNADESSLSDFFEAVIKDCLSSGGKVFSSPDQKAIIVWTSTVRGSDSTNEFKKRWQEVLGPEGVKRYYWVYETGYVDFNPHDYNKIMEPEYLAVYPGYQRSGYGGHLIKWSYDYFEKEGYDKTPYILPSTRGSAKLYGPLLGYHIVKEIFADGKLVALSMKRNE
ncbi:MULTISPECIES: GNAT family N-acetyltransferase [unclassified Chryseobacterium]|uniref:GNAT family N-acetyltransferase n=1 Tax=unclassified Chryseobacterium TaxID=2593645 RepID=UPI000F4471AC|nr:GNAT family N-acetyltransferase [Chryseobacterium sp. G0240]ROI02054.1 N-acetyltransferase [Chryseobacterium sp. G0240]